MNKNIIRANKENWKICIYGLGTIWNNVGSEYLRILNVSPDYYCDTNTDVLKSFKCNFGKKISVEELLRLDEITLVLVFLSPKYYEDVLSQLKFNEKIQITTFKELIDDDEVIKKILGLESLPGHKSEFKITPPPCKSDFLKKRIAVYTCITDKYDKVKEPLRIEDCCDYYCITDMNDVQSGHSYQRYIDVDSVTPKGITSSVDKNRYCKMHGFKIFHDYDYSIYIDGSIKVLGALSILTDSLNLYGLGLHPNPYAYDPYMEALFLLANKRADKDKLVRTLEFLADQGIKRHCGCFEGGVVVTDNSNDYAKQILQRWFDNYMAGEVKRDQLYLQLSLQQLGIETEELDVYKKSFRFGELIRVLEHEQ